MKLLVVKFVDSSDDGEGLEDYVEAMMRHFSGDIEWDRDWYKEQDPPLGDDGDSYEFFVNVPDSEMFFFEHWLRENPTLIQSSDVVIDIEWVAYGFDSQEAKIYRLQLFKKFYTKLCTELRVELEQSGVDLTELLKRRPSHG